MSTKYDVQDQPMSAQVITVTAVSEDSIDLGAAGVDKTVNVPMCYEIIPRNNAGGTVVATTYQFEAIETTDAALSAGLLVLSSISKAGSAVKNGERIILPLPKGSMSLRYQGLRVTVAGGTAPTCTFDAFLVPLAEVEYLKQSPARPAASYPA